MQCKHSTASLCMSKSAWSDREGLHVDEYKDLVVVLDSNTEEHMRT